MVTRAGLSYDINDQWLLENRLGYQDREVSVNMKNSVPFGGYLADTIYETFSYSPVLHYYSNAIDWLFGFDLSKDNLDAKTNYGDSKYERKTLAFLARPDFRYQINGI